MSLKLPDFVLFFMIIFFDDIVGGIPKEDSPCELE